MDPLLVSTEPESDFAHIQQFSDYLSVFFFCEYHTSHRPFSTVIHIHACTRMAQVWVRTHSSMHGHLRIVVVCLSDCLDISIHFFFHTLLRALLGYTARASHIVQAMTRWSEAVGDEKVGHGCSRVSAGLWLQRLLHRHES